jgi:hypothetical protein
VQFLFDCASSANPEVKEVALHMFASVPGVFGNQGKRNKLTTVLNLLHSWGNPAASFLLVAS